MVVTICLRQGDDKVRASLDLLRDHVLFKLEDPQVHFHKNCQWFFPGLKINFITGGELRNGVNGALRSYATDSVRFSKQILDKEHAGMTNVFIRWI